MLAEQNLQTRKTRPRGERFAGLLPPGLKPDPRYRETRKSGIPKRYKGLSPTGTTLSMAK
jgi:hypothetical protein